MSRKITTVDSENNSKTSIDQQNSQECIVWDSQPRYIGYTVIQDRCGSFMVMAMLEKERMTFFY